MKATRAIAAAALTVPLIAPAAPPTDSYLRSVWPTVIGVYERPPREGISALMIAISETACPSKVLSKYGWKFAFLTTTKGNTGACWTYADGGLVRQAKLCLMDPLTGEVSPEACDYIPMRLFTPRGQK